MLCRVLLDANSGEHQLRLIEIHPRWFQKVFRAKRWIEHAWKCTTWSLTWNLSPQKFFFRILSQLQLQFWKVSLYFSEGNGLHPPFWIPIFGFFNPFKDGGRHPHLHQGMWASAGAILKGNVHLNQNEAHHYHPTQLLALHQAPARGKLSWQSLGMIFWGPFLVGTVDGGEKSAVIPVDGKRSHYLLFLNLSQLVQDFLNHQTVFSRFIPGVMISYCTVLKDSMQQPGK